MANNVLAVANNVANNCHKRQVASPQSVHDVGAYRTVTRNLVAADGSAEPLTIAEMSASGFRVARVPPALGRYLLDADEGVGAPAVVIIGPGTPTGAGSWCRMPAGTWRSCATTS